MKYLLAITITLLPSAVLGQQFTPEQMLDVMTKSPTNRDVRVHDGLPPLQPDFQSERGYDELEPETEPKPESGDESHLKEVDNLLDLFKPR